ncbi:MULTISPECIES: hypothetical protein, partial [Bartonella]|uniref:hypothetical protein n=1 Tax=Bartonella TaxID=773 RepID=UPI001AED99C2
LIYPFFPRAQLTVASGVPPSLWRSYRPHFLPESTDNFHFFSFFFIFSKTPLKRTGLPAKFLPTGFQQLITEDFLVKNWPHSFFSRKPYSAGTVFEQYVVVLNYSSQSIECSYQWQQII